MVSELVKIPLKAQQIDDLLQWRDEHKELVRAAVIPFPECEIISENGVKIRVKQQAPFSTVYGFTVSDTIAHEVNGRFNYATLTGIVTHGAPQLSHEDTQTAITVWATVMAYIVNFKPEVIEKESEETAHEATPKNKTRRKAANKPANRVIYLNPISYTTNEKNRLQRKYTAPACAFSVRGHYRHLKSGKIVYVHPYEKNAGKSKDTRNKIVKIMEV